MIEILDVLGKVLLAVACGWGLGALGALVWIWLEGRWRFRRSRSPVDDERLKRVALSVWGITRPIRVVWMTDSERKLGVGLYNYALLADEHRISLAPGRLKVATLGTLAHELTHAMQAERIGSAGKWWRESLHQKKNWDYETRPIEIEAREVATYRWRTLEGVLR